MPTLTIRIPERLRERAEMTALAKGQTLDHVIRMALAEYATGKYMPSGSADRLAVAAQDAQEYYATDPDARLWAEFPGDEADYA